jgi:hypothetical protein
MHRHRHGVDLSAAITLERRDTPTIESRKKVAGMKALIM